jgi:hypothetical protein
VVQEVLGLGKAMQPLGAIGVGYPDGAARERPPRDPASFLLTPPPN